MAHVSLPEGLPGITGLLEYRLDTAAPIRELTQILLRGPSSLSQGERELIATVVSHRNQCRFCATAHTAAADLLLGEHETSTAVKDDVEAAPVSDKMKALLTIAAKVQESGRLVTEEDVSTAADLGECLLPACAHVVPVAYPGREDVRLRVHGSCAGLERSEACAHRRDLDASFERVMAPAIIPARYDGSSNAKTIPARLLPVLLPDVVT